MSGRVGAMAMATVAALAANFFGVVFFFRPIAENDAPSGELLPPVLGLLSYVLLSVAVLDWASRRFGQPVRIALVIAASQVILVVDLVLRGERGIATGAAGSALILCTWLAMGFVYKKALFGSDRSTVRESPERLDAGRADP